MPIYEYACGQCGREFEALVSRATAASCPTCGSTTLERRLSVFAVAAGGSRASEPAAPGPCGACGDPRGPGSCQRN